MARTWALAGRLQPKEIVCDDYVRKLHRRMFDQTWKWAGQYRRTEKNIGVPFHEIPERMAALLGDVCYWIDHQTYPPDELAIRFHHRLVLIHAFPNGNGRHARMIAELLVMSLGGAAFSWGAVNLTAKGEARASYLQTLRIADDGEVGQLLKFARS